ncbi:MAG: hypothetical protein ACR2M2_04860 [Gaiellaceae bacterium]
MKQPKPTGLPLVDGLAELNRPTLDDFIKAASEYIVASVDMESIIVEGKEVKPAARKKAGQIRLSNALGRALAADLQEAWPEIKATSGEITVSGALRSSQIDVVEMTQLDGLKLAVELKPINLAVGRAIWNRFGDIRVTAVSTHLKYPFAVAGGVLTIPTVEWGASKAAPGGEWRSTEHLIARLCELLRRAGGRRREDDAPHRLEAVAVVAFDPLTSAMRTDLPPPGLGLTWKEAVASLVEAYVERFPPADVSLMSAAGGSADEADEQLADERLGLSGDDAE